MNVQSKPLPELTEGRDSYLGARTRDGRYDSSINSEADLGITQRSGRNFLKDLPWRKRSQRFVGCKNEATFFYRLLGWVPDHFLAL